jgi:hypothetical protein
MVSARRIVRRHFGRDYHPLLRLFAQVLAAIAWLPAVLIHLSHIRRDHGPDVVPIKRVPGALWTALRHNILPSEYYAYALWRPDRRANIDNYLYCHEAARLFKVLNGPPQPNPLGDKLAFHEVCKCHDLPTPAVLAAFAPNRKIQEFESGQPPERNLFVKPSRSFGGSGAERFRWDGVAFENDNGWRLRAADLDEYLANRARNENRTLLVQPLLANDPELRADSKGFLATARLVTGRSTNDDVVPIFGFLYFALFDDRRATAPWQFEGLIDVASGRLISSPLQGTSSFISRCQLGPDDAYKLPQWDAVLRHTKAAHRACPHFVFIAWDVALTDQGPMLLEGNVNWGPGTYQWLRGEPLGHTKFAAVLATHLDSERLTSPCLSAGP